DKYIQDKQRIQAEKARINGADIYSDDYKKGELSKMDNLMTSITYQFREDVAEIIEGKKSEIQAPHEKTLDVEYQTRLSNEVRILDMTGKTMSEQDIDVMIQPFKDDYIAMQGIKGALERSGRDNAFLALPADFRGETIKRLDGINNHVQEVVGEYNNNFFD